MHPFTYRRAHRTEDILSLVAVLFVLRRKLATRTSVELSPRTGWLGATDEVPATMTLETSEKV